MGHLNAIAILVRTVISYGATSLLPSPAHNTNPVFFSACSIYIFICLGSFSFHSFFFVSFLSSRFLSILHIHSIYTYRKIQAYLTSRCKSYIAAIPFLGDIIYHHAVPIASLWFLFLVSPTLFSLHFMPFHQDFFSLFFSFFSHQATRKTEKREEIKAIEAKEKRQKGMPFQSAIRNWIADIHWPHVHQRLCIYIHSEKKSAHKCIHHLCG